MAEFDPLRGFRITNCLALYIILLFYFALNSCKNSASKVPEGSAADPKAQGEIQDTGTVSQANSTTILGKSIAKRSGDFDSMFKYRVIRVLAPYSRTLFFNDKGRERGLTADYVREFERFLNLKYRNQLNHIPITVAIIPTPRDQLITGVLQGLGDLAAGNLTATDERMKRIDFFAPDDWLNVSEIVLTRKRDGPLSNIEELSGKSICVRKSSSYYNSLQKVNQMLTGKGKPPAKLELVSENLEDEDLMEMLDAGIITAIVVDDWKAKMWGPILPNIVLNENIAVSTGGHVGWAFRKNSPMLDAELKDFYHSYAKRLGIIPYRFKVYNRQVKSLQDPTGSDSWKRYQQIMKLFEKYGGSYDFDPLMLAAMGFQESQLDQSIRSPVGAIGIMQVMPKTGASMKVGDITVTEHNIHAGTKYMNNLMSTYFKDTHFDRFNKSLFAFASYNAGPNKISGLREIAAERGLDPNQWLNNVEIVASEKIGRETTTYVRNIIKYYYSYKLMLELSEKQRKHREAF